MIFETKYDPGKKVFLVIGSGEKAKILESTISSIVCVVMTAAGKISTTYNCTINRLDAGTVVQGMPMYYDVEKSDTSLFDTFEECVESLKPKHAKK